MSYQSEPFHENKLLVIYIEFVHPISIRKPVKRREACEIVIFTALISVESYGYKENYMNYIYLRLFILGGLVLFFTKNNTLIAAQDRQWRREMIGEVIQEPEKNKKQSKRCSFTNTLRNRNTSKSNFFQLKRAI